jgi:hypothetical protein
LRRSTAPNGHDPEQRPQDNSRSGVAFRKGLALVRQNATYEQMCEVLRADPETAEWVREEAPPAMPMWHDRAGFAPHSALPLPAQKERCR